MKKSLLVMMILGAVCSGCAQNNMATIEPVEVEPIAVDEVFEPEEKIMVLREYVAATGKMCQEVIVADNRKLRCQDGGGWQMMPQIYP